MKRFLLAMVVAFGAAMPAAAAPLPPPPLSGPLLDPGGMLPPETEERVYAAAEAFRRATRHWMIIVVLPQGRDIDLSSLEDTVVAPWEPSLPRTPIGIVYAATPDEREGKLLVVDPEWREVAPALLISMFPQRLAQKYGDEPFAERVALSARYLADVFPPKIAFLTQPPDHISEESVAFSKDVMTAVKWFVYFIILFTFFRTFFPARLREGDSDEVSQELRRLTRERQIW